jgi:hypothetical protein
VRPYSHSRGSRGYHSRHRRLPAGR